jgi:hypothetical protein
MAETALLFVGSPLLVVPCAVIAASSAIIWIAWSAGAESGLLPRSQRRRSSKRTQLSAEPFAATVLADTTPKRLGDKGLACTRAVYPSLWDALRELAKLALQRELHPPPAAALQSTIYPPAAAGAPAAGAPGKAPPPPVDDAEVMRAVKQANPDVTLLLVMAKDVPLALARLAALKEDTAPDALTDRAFFGVVRTGPGRYQALINDSNPPCYTFIV